MAAKREYDKRTIFVPKESEQGHFRTSDSVTYRRGSDGVIRRLTPKKRRK